MGNVQENCFKQPAQIELEEKKSRFIGIGLPCATLAAFEELYEQQKERFADATHITYAYRIRENGELRIRFNDAGEPSGTAGKPILAHLSGHQLINCVIFVIRYFGGIKLGAGGLVRAYSAAAGKVVEAASLVPFIEWETLFISFPYDRQQQVDYILAKTQIEIEERHYSEKVTYKIKTPKQLSATYKAELGCHGLHVEFHGSL
jgi:uncharacterized YigZ family protein